MQRWVLLLVIGFSGMAALFIWREWTHRAARAAWLEEATALEGQVGQLEAAVVSARATIGSLEETLAQKDMTEQSLRDRMGNLEAQRDHLQTEVKRQADRVRIAESGIEAARAEVETARQALLEQSARPRELEGRLGQAQARIETMEDAMDASAAALAEAPPLLTLDGLSGNRSVFSLTGELPAADALPLPVYLCRREKVVLEGWIHRRENGLAIGHVSEWREPASNLVKGEKVFILRRNHHEAEP
jgi:predicted  nucleic acid-binding Zn-ribbon protein